MSIISSAASSLFSFLQGVSANTPTSATSAAGSNTSTGTTTASNGSAGGLVSGHHHHHGGGFQKVADAITSALQAAANSSSGSSAVTDPNQTIVSALEKIFKNGSLGSIGSDSDNDENSGETNQSGLAQNTTGSGASTNGLPPQFVQALQSFGVTAQQFQSDVSTALQNAKQNGSVDISDLFKSFPPGSAIDTVG
jgi:hypothetical protein